MFGLRYNRVPSFNPLWGRKCYSSAYHHIQSSSHIPPSLEARLPPDFNLKVDKSSYDCLDTLKKFDKSSELLYHYIPDPAKNAFLAVKCFNIEMSKINTGLTNDSLNISSGFNVVDLKFKFWEEMLFKLSTGESIGGGGPIGILFQDALLKDLHVDVNFLSTFINNKKMFLKNPSFKTVEDVCSYGEGTYSQINYFIQGLMLSPDISPSTISLVERSPEIQTLATDIAAHIGQATAVATMITGLKYFAQHKNQITLPLDILSKHNLPEESLFRIFQGHIEPSTKEFEKISSLLKDAIFETSIVANDHVLTARQKFNQLQQQIAEILSDTDETLLLTQSKNWLKNVPDALYIPFMSILPIELYLKRLEKNDFDIFSQDLTVKDWKLLWRSYWNYNQRLL